MDSVKIDYASTKRTWKQPTTTEEAKKIGEAYNANIVVWGSISKAGHQLSLCSHLVSPQDVVFEFCGIIAAFFVGDKMDQCMSLDSLYTGYLADFEDRFRSNLYCSPLVREG